MPLGGYHPTLHTTTALRVPLCGLTNPALTDSVNGPLLLNSKIRTGAGREIRSNFPPVPGSVRSEEHTSELQSLTNIVCRLLLEKKKMPNNSSSEAYSSTRTGYTRTLGS